MYDMKYVYERKCLTFISSFSNGIQTTEAIRRRQTAGKDTMSTQSSQKGAVCCCHSKQTLVIDWINSDKTIIITEKPDHLVQLI